MLSRSSLLTKARFINTTPRTLTQIRFASDNPSKMSPSQTAAGATTTSNTGNTQENSAGMGKSHATGDSVVPEVIQKAAPEAVEKALPDAVHDTSAPGAKK